MFALSRFPKRGLKRPRFLHRLKSREGELPFDVEMAVRLRVGVVISGDSCAIAAAAKARFEARVVFILVVGTV